MFGLLLLGGAAYGADIALSSAKVPRGVVVAGVNIGGMGKVEAQGVLEQHFAEQSTRPVTVRGGAKSVTLDPVSSGLAVDLPGTVAAAGAQDYNPISRVASFFTTREVPVVSTVNNLQFDRAVDYAVSQLALAPVDAQLALVDGQAKVTPGVVGQAADPAEVAKLVREEWLDAGGVEVPVAETQPQISTAAAQKVADGDAAKALRGDLVAHGVNPDGAAGDGVIPLARMGEVVTFRPAGDQLITEVNAERAQQILAEGLAPTESEMRNARISFDSGAKVVTPSQPGHEIDWEALMDHFQDRVLGDAPRTWDAKYTDIAPTFTTDDAEKATFNERVSTFTTGGFSQASGVNIRRVAEMVNGAIVAPGQTFSLNGYTGPRGTAQGFVESGIIMNGHADKAVGGGISQFATTLYNAAYFAGMQDVAHTAHSYYISRYPAGREATVFEGAIDLQFKNTTPYPVQIRTSWTPSNITVSMYGVKTLEVESINGGRWATTQPQPITLSGSNCVPSSGAPGFTTSDTRIVRDLQGREISRNTTTTTYDPAPIVRCN